MSAAREFAILAHGDQLYGGHPYVQHLHDVYCTLLRFGIFTGPLLEAAWLHDVLEDTEVTETELRARFTDEIAALVVAVTNEPGGRAERAAKTYAKIRAAGPGAVWLKLADRIANVEHSIVNGTRHLKMYQEEFPAFSAALYRPGERDDMWAHLRGLVKGGAV